MAGPISYPSTVYKILRVPSTFDANFSLVTSPIFSPLTLALIRLALALYGTVFLIITLVRSCLTDHDGKQCVRLVHYLYDPVFPELYLCTHLDTSPSSRSYRTSVW